MPFHADSCRDRVGIPGDTFGREILNLHAQRENAPSSPFFPHRLCRIGGNYAFSFRERVEYVCQETVFG